MARRRQSSWSTLSVRTQAKTGEARSSSRIERALGGWVVPAPPGPGAGRGERGAGATRALREAARDTGAHAGGGPVRPPAARSQVEGRGLSESPFSRLDEQGGLACQGPREDYFTEGYRVCCEERLMEDTLLRGTVKGQMTRVRTHAHPCSHAHKHTGREAGLEDLPHNVRLYQRIKLVTCLR